MIGAPKDGYIKALCIETRVFIDEVWGDCTIEEGKWYQVLCDHHMCTDEYLMVKFEKLGWSHIVPHQRSMFKTEAQLRDEKLNNIGI